MVANHAQHIVFVGLEARERPQFAGHFRAGGVGIAREDRREGRTPLSAFFAVVGNAHAHEHGSEVGVAQAQRAVFVAELSDGLAGELGHQHGDFEHHGPQADGVSIAFQVKAAILGEERAEIQRRQVAGRVIQEHVLGARVARIDAPGLGARVPIVDGGVVLQARIGAGPGGVVNLGPQILGAQILHGPAIHAARELPFTVPLQGAHEGIGHAHRIVGILAAHGGVGFAIPGGVVLFEIASEITLLQAADALGDKGGGHTIPLGLG